MQADYFSTAVITETRNYWSWISEENLLFEHSYRDHCDKWFRDPFRTAACWVWARRAENWNLKLAFVTKVCTDYDQQTFLKYLSVCLTVLNKIHWRSCDNKLLYQSYNFVFSNSVLFLQEPGEGRLEAPHERVVGVQNSRHHSDVPFAAPSEEHDNF